MEKLWAKKSPFILKGLDSERIYLLNLSGNSMSL